MRNIVFRSIFPRRRNLCSPDLHHQTISNSKLQTKNLSLSLASLRTIWRAEALRRVALLAPLSGAERGALAAALQPRVAEAGSDVVIAGEPGSEFFLVESGELDVLAPPRGAGAAAAAAPAAGHAAASAADGNGKGGEEKGEGEPPAVVGRIGAGGYFGELSLLRGEPRAATVRAATRCELLALPRQDFEALLGPAKALLAAGASSYGRAGGEFFSAFFFGGGVEVERSRRRRRRRKKLSSHFSSLFRHFFPFTKKAGPRGSRTCAAWPSWARARSARSLLSRPPRRLPPPPQRQRPRTTAAAAAATRKTATPLLLPPPPPPPPLLLLLLLLLPPSPSTPSRPSPRPPWSRPAWSSTCGGSAPRWPSATRRSS